VCAPSGMRVLCRFVFFRRLEFELSCTHDKRVDSIVYYHSNSPLALWKRYLFSVSNVKFRGELYVTHSFLLVVRMPSLRVHFHLFLTRCTLSYVHSM
jgi:hypothetical protein